jgi:Zn finger protein HypA/HybF involved in hydrogenase expression
MSLAAKEVNIPYSTFKRKAQQLGVWKPNRGAKGSSKIIKPLSDIFEGTRTMKSYNLKNRLISEGYKKSKCEECGISETWNGKFLTLELDHIDGNNRNNSLDNLKILCPNCHSQTPTFRGRKNKMHE